MDLTELKQLNKDTFHDLLNEPTLENFRNFMWKHTGEHNAIDFKAEWLEESKLAKEILAIANFGGGIIVFGVKENDDGSFDCTGLSVLQDKADVEKQLKKYISPDLKYAVFDFSYSASEYKPLEGKKFQVLVIDNTPTYLPFISLKSGKNIKEATIYTRRGTSCVIANESDIRQILDRRLNVTLPNGNQQLSLSNHLEQLKILYANIETTVQVPASSLIGFNSVYHGFLRAFGERKPNPLYPKESFEAFVVSMIQAKKEKIKRVLDLK